MSPESKTGLAILVVPAILTDDLAMFLLSKLSAFERLPEGFVDSIKQLPFVLPGNSEWQIKMEVRKSLQASLFHGEEGRALRRQVDDLVLQFADTSDQRLEVPTYLRDTHLGKAYHLAAQEPWQSLIEYSNARETAPSNLVYLAGLMAEEQQDQGLLPIDAVQPPFLRGWSLRQEGSNRKATHYFERVEQFGGNSLETAISLHILGHQDLKGRRWATAERRLKRSLKILRAGGDRHGQAQVLHTLGQLYMKMHGRQNEAEQPLLDSLKILRSGGDRHGQAQVLHTLGQLYMKMPRRQNEAEQPLLDSLEIGRAIGHRHHQAQVLHTLGQLYMKMPGRQSEAEQPLLDSLEILRAGGDRHGQAQVLHTLGQLYMKMPGRQNEAEQPLLDSLELNQALGLRRFADIVRKRLRQLWSGDT